MRLRRLAFDPAVERTGVVDSPNDDDRSGFWYSLAGLAALVLEETWRQRLPLGSLANPGPAYFPGVLALLLLLVGAALAAVPAGGPPVASLQWREWRHAIAIFAACMFSAVALGRLGYRLTIVLALGFLVGVVERKPLVATLLFAGAVAFGTFWLFDRRLRTEGNARAHPREAASDRARGRQRSRVQGGDGQALDAGGLQAGRGLPAVLRGRREASRLGRPAGGPGRGAGAVA